MSVEQVCFINFKGPEDGVGRMVSLDCEVEPDEQLGTPVERPRWQSVVLPYAERLPPPALARRKWNHLLVGDAPCASFINRNRRISRTMMLCCIGSIMNPLWLVP